jgi:hypothetical protein
MEHKKISITTYSVEKITVHHQKISSTGHFTGRSDVPDVERPELPIAGDQMSPIAGPDTDMATKENKR